MARVPVRSQAPVRAVSSKDTAEGAADGGTRRLIAIPRRIATGNRYRRKNSQVAAPEQVKAAKAHGVDLRKVDQKVDRKEDPKEERKA